MGRDFGPLRAWGFSAPLWRSDMRLAAIASALAIVLCVAVFGAILFQKASLPVPAPAPPQATPTDGRAPGSAVTVTDSAPERSPMPAASTMHVAMQTSCSN